MPEITLNLKKLKASKAVTLKADERKPVYTAIYTDVGGSITLNITFLLESPEQKDLIPQEVTVKWL